MKTIKLENRLLVLGFAFSLIVCMGGAQADDWGVHVSPGGWGFHYGSGSGHINIESGPRYYYGPRPVYVAPPPPGYYYRGSGPYYPNYNPVVRRDVDGGTYYAPDGTVHSEETVEDRHSSYYSPGRNEAITPPRTSTSYHYGPDGSYHTRERTTWIGADGRPHSTTIDQNTSQDIWGNTHTDTHVSLKNKKTSEGAVEEPSSATQLMPKKEEQPAAKTEQK
jgi:hypothetical protein